MLPEPGTLVLENSTSQPRMITAVVGNAVHFGGCAAVHASCFDAHFTRLEGCPFCGGHDLKSRVARWAPVICKSCSGQAPAAVWNRRVATPKPDAAHHMTEVAWRLANLSWAGDPRDLDLWAASLEQMAGLIPVVVCDAAGTRLDFAGKESRPAKPYSFARVEL